jgi:hypothetical protein
LNLEKSDPAAADSELVTLVPACFPPLVGSPAEGAPSLLLDKSGV